MAALAAGQQGQGFGGEAGETDVGVAGQAFHYAKADELLMGE